MNMGQDRQMQMVGGNGRNQFRQYAGQNVGNQNGYNTVQNFKNPVNPNGNGNVVAARAEGNANRNNGNQIRCYNCRGLGHLARNYIVRPRRRDATYLQTQLLIAQKEEAGIQLQAEEFDLMTAVGDLDEIKEVNANCILMANLQQASTSGTQTDNAPVYDSDGSAKSSCIKNKDVEVEEHHKNLLLSKNKRHKSSECNNVKLAIRNDKSEVICAMCKQCLITANHDVCVLNYVNGMNSHGKKQKANVSNIANQTKPNPKASKPKKVGSKQRLASPKPKKPITFLRWSPTGRFFDLKGKIIASSESECQSDCSNGDHECTSNP
ncbi:hypothetical protein Tco_0111384 [Tanacetum coccineum]